MLVRLNTIFFDLDDTIYPTSTGIWSAIRERMNTYMLERLHIPAEQVPRLREFYFKTYGTTLRGLQHHYNVNPAEFLEFVHDLPIESLLQANPALRELLLSLPLRRFVFTNADHAHAGRVLGSLGISDCFEAVIDVWAMDFHCKPEAAAYQIALQRAGSPDPGECAYLDDSPRNLAPARALGFYTILVGCARPDPAAHLSIAGLAELRLAAPRLWENGAHGHR